MDESLIFAMQDKGYTYRDSVVFVRAKGCCEYCGAVLIHNRIIWDAVQFDHIIPKSKGGGDEVENLALACKPCNNTKMTFIPSGGNRHERIISARCHIKERGEHAQQFWKSISELFKSHGYT